MKSEDYIEGSRNNKALAGFKTTPLDREMTNIIV
jgi:hypothetical protein